MGPHTRRLVGCVWPCGDGPACCRCRCHGSDPMQLHSDPLALLTPCGCCRINSFKSRMATFRMAAYTDVFMRGAGGSAGLSRRSLPAMFARLMQLGSSHAGLATSQVGGEGLCGRHALVCALQTELGGGRDVEREEE